MRKLLLIAGLFLLSAHLFAQQRTVTGRVTDEKGGPVFGASITIKGTKAGTSSSSDGGFSIAVPAGAKKLTVSGVGFETQELEIAGLQNLNVVMKPQNKNLEEVLVVGYGVKTVRENTGSVSKVKGEKLANEPVQSIDQALAGKTAGVQITLGSGVLADRTAIRVRGINSISSSSQPLVVIDGIPQNANTYNLNGFNSGNGTRFDPLQLINPDDIESIDVLKDAGAAVIYGSRASNGVIVITTKRGRKGTTKVSFDSKAGWASARKVPSLLNADQFITITNEKGSNRFGAGSPAAGMAKTSDVDGDGKNDNTNWMDVLYRTAQSYDNSISFSGGADRLSVYGSARYLSQEGITIGNKLTTGQARLNMDFTPKTWFKSGLQLSYAKTLNQGVLSDGYIAGTTISGWQAEPNVSPYDPKNPTGYNLTANGLLGNGNNVTTIGGVNYLPGASYYLNLLPQIYLQRNNNTAQDLRANIYGTVTPIAGLSLTSKFGIQYLTNFEDQYSSPLVNGLGYSYGGLEQEQRREYDQWNWQNYASYDKTFAGVHKIGVVAGTEYQKNTYFAQYTGAGNFTDPFYNHIVDGAYTNTQPGTTTLLDNTGGNLSANGLMSYFGRLNYTYAGKYFIEGSFRRDGYSAFGVNRQFGNFPSVSAGWEMTKEDFMQGIHWLDYLKIRGSYGQVGNSGNINDYASLNLYAGATYTSLNGLAITQAGNADLRWETSKKTDFGFDATILKGKVNITADYFKNNINGLILAAPILYTVGVPTSSINTNIGGMYNRGVELTVGSTVVSNKDFTWTTSINFTRIWNKVTGLIPNNNNADIVFGQSVASVGKRLGTFYLPVWAGVDPATGNPRWFAKDGSVKQYNYGAPTTSLWTDGKGTAVAALSGSDYVYQKRSGLPTFYGGWDNTFSYKGFDLNVSITYQGGNYIYNSSKAGMMTNQFSNNYSDILRRWTTAGQQTDVPKLWLGSDNTGNQASTRWLEKGDFIRFRTITVGYTVPKKLLNRIGFDNIRVYAQAFNPFVITKYSGLDPDVSTSGTTQNSSTTNGNIQVGVDSRATPQPKIFTVGLNLGF